MNNKKTAFIMRIIFTLLFILWMIAIFILSSQNAEQSNDLSGNFIEKILQIKDEMFSENDNKKSESLVEVDNISKDISEKETKEKPSSNRIQKWQNFTRKMAHYAIYTVEGLIIYCMVVVYSKKQNATIRKILIAISIGVFSAILDEMHQFFSDGRTPQITDVIIDSLGIITGIIIAIILGVIINKIVNCIYERRKKVND